MSRLFSVTAALLLLSLSSAPAQGDALTDLEKTPLVRALSDELKRSMTLQLPGMAKPYYISYLVQEGEQLSVLGEFGGTVMVQRNRGRQLSMDLRVGDYKKDNTNFLGRGGGGNGPLALDDDYDALRRQIWLSTDRAYKVAAQAMEEKRATMADSKGSGDGVNDFSKIKPTRLCLEPPPALPDEDKAKALVRSLGALLMKDPMVQEGIVEFNAVRGTRTLISSEGSLVREPFGVLTIAVAAGAQAKDGMPLKHYIQRAFPLDKGLPALAPLAKAARTMLSQLAALRTAPLQRDFSGPVLFEDRAAAQVLLSMLQPQLSGTPGVWARGSRLPPRSKWAGKLGRRVLTSTFSLVDDPTLTAVGKVPVIGHLRVDDQGVPARKVELVKDGKLKALLTNRTPSKSFPLSNGHARGRGYGGAEPTPTTLMLMAPGKSATALRRMAVSEAKKEGEQYGMIIRQLPEHGITSKLSGVATMGGGHQMDGLLAYRVDARGEETLVRGIKLEMPDVKALRRIMAAGKELVVLNSLEGGGPSHGRVRVGLPLSLVTPALLLDEVELSKERGSQTNSPMLPRP